MRDCFDLILKIFLFDVYFSNVNLIINFPDIKAYSLIASCMRHQCLWGRVLQLWYGAWRMSGACRVGPASGCVAVMNQLGLRWSVFYFIDLTITNIIIFIHNNQYIYIYIYIYIWFWSPRLRKLLFLRTKQMS